MNAKKWFAYCVFLQVAVLYGCTEIYHADDIGLHFYRLEESIDHKLSVYDGDYYLSGFATTRSAVIYSARGELSTEQYDKLQELFTEDLTDLYAEDSLYRDNPNDETEPTPDSPVYRIVYNDGVGRYVEDKIEHNETLIMISALSDLLDQLLLEHEIQADKLLAEL